MRGLPVLLLLVFLPVLGNAQCPGVTTQLTPFAREQLTISTAPQPLTANVYKPSGTTPAMALISIEGGMIRYAVVGTPTTTTGHPVGGTLPQTLLICGLDSIAAFSAIRTTTDATLTATYYKVKGP